MAAVAFDTLKCARRLKEAGYTDEQAEVQAELMAEAFVHNLDSLVTRDYLDARLETLSAQLKGRFLVQDWILGAIAASTVLPTLYSLFNP